LLKKYATLFLFRGHDSLVSRMNSELMPSFSPYSGVCLRLSGGRRPFRSRSLRYCSPFCCHFFLDIPVRGLGPLKGRIMSEPDPFLFSIPLLSAIPFPLPDGSPLRVDYTPFKPGSPPFPYGDLMHSPSVSTGSRLRLSHKLVTPLRAISLILVPVTLCSPCDKRTTCHDSSSVTHRH